MTHEVGHAIKKDAPRKFEELKDFIKKNFYTDGSWDAAVNTRYEQYKKMLGEFTWEKAEEEVVCNSLGRILGSSRVMNKLYSGHRSLFGRIWQLVKGFFDRIAERIKKIGKYSNKTVEQRIVEEGALLKRRKLENMFVNALRSANESAIAHFDVKGAEKESHEQTAAEDNKTPETAENEALTSINQKNMHVSYSLTDESPAKIREGMSDIERFEVLKEKVISIAAKPDMVKLNKAMQKMNIFDSEFELSKYGDKKRLFKKLGEEFGVFRRYNNPDIKVAFSFSKGGVTESVNKQRKEYMKLAKLLSCIDSVIENAVGVESHNRNGKGYKIDKTLKNVYVLASAFDDGDAIVPVKLEVKEFVDKENTLYVAIALESIKKNEIVKQEVATNGVAQQYSPSFTISISKIFEKINPSDKNFLKYIPDGFLNEEQKQSKNEALREEKNIASSLDSQQYKSNISYSLADSADREILAEAFYNLAENDEERAKVRAYRKEIALIDEKLADRNRLIRRLEEMGGTRGSVTERTKINNQIQVLDDIITRHDQKLLELSAAKPFRNIVERYERDAKKSKRSDEHTVVMTRGEFNKFKADYTHDKVYSKKDAKIC